MDLFKKDIPTTKLSLFEEYMKLTLRRTRATRLTSKRTQAARTRTQSTTTTPKRRVSYQFPSTVFVPYDERRKLLRQALKFFNFALDLPPLYKDFYLWYYGVLNDKHAEQKRNELKGESFTIDDIDRNHILDHTVFPIPGTYLNHYVEVNYLAARTTDKFALPSHLTFARSTSSWRTWSYRFDDTPEPTTDIFERYYSKFRTTTESTTPTTSPTGSTKFDFWVWVSSLHQTASPSFEDYSELVTILDEMMEKENKTIYELLPSYI